MCKKCMSRPATFHASVVTTSQVKSVIPERLFIPKTPLSLYYLSRDLVVMAVLAYSVWTADVYLNSDPASAPINGLHILVAPTRGILWCFYWWFQSLTFAALWLLAHECGHGSFSPYSILNDGVGFILHSFLGTPYYSWKYSHRQHHRFNGHLEKDEHYIPNVRDPSQDHVNSQLWDSIEDTPIFQVVKLIFQQLFGFQSYLFLNVSGQPSYPRWTSHFNPYSILFRSSQRFDIFLSDIGLIVNVMALFRVAQVTPMNMGAVVRLYVIPWIFLNHWIAMIVSLQHTDVVLPRYRDGAYTYARGALVTVDREFLGWQGKFFLHGVTHFHVVHHFFPTMPFYHLEEATEYAKPVLGDDYCSCDTPVFQALWENLLKCRYVDSKGDIVFYRDKYGSAKFQNSDEAVINKRIS